MAGNFRVFVGLPVALAPFGALLPGTSLYTLQPDADLAVLPFDDELQDRLHDRFGTGDWPDDQGIALSTTDQTFAAGCSRHAPLAFLQCDDGDGVMQQSAALWQLGQLTIGPATLDLSGPGGGRAVKLRPINVALRTLGVMATASADECSVFGLAGYASNADIRARAWPVRG